MLKELLENKLPTKLLIISDRENATGADLFVCALKNQISHDSKRKINLICYERPPSCYLPTSSEENVVLHDHFADPLRWNDPSTPPSDLSSVAPTDGVFFLDSFTLLAHYHGYSAAYRALSALKASAAKTVCLVHSDILDEEQVEEIRFLATGFVSLGELAECGNAGERMGERVGEGMGERMGEVVYRKSGGKVVKQCEVFSVDDDLKVRIRTSERKVQKQSSGKEEFEGLTTFSLGLKMSERERKAREELVLPYVKSRGAGGGGGEIIYEADTDELEEDPDDDLDI